MEPTLNPARLLSVRLLVVVALLLCACGGNAAASPTPAPFPLAQAELKYRVMDAGGRISFCDPDFYPIARADESEIAKTRIDEIRRDTETYAAITKRTGTDILAVYHDWKALSALRFTAAGARWTFNYRSTGNSSPAATPDPKSSGKQIEGSVDVFGIVDISKRSDAGPLNCPICLASGTRIATPSGEVAVDQLRLGDIVWTQGDDGARMAAPLVAIGNTPVAATHEVVRIVLGDGRTVRVSPGHPTADGRHVGDIRAGDTLDGARVISAERESYAGGFTFDVRPAGPSGAYWANGVLLLTTLR